MFGLGGHTNKYLLLGILFSIEKGDQTKLSVTIFYCSIHLLDNILEIEESCLCC